ncbi:hypothetical protein FYZ45_04435 [Mobiluncus mulieris]|nr:hypothetical protein [Mobiluncus mulieris]MCU9996292.1 hypothetical protein [Mobiluncus mulieris]MCV0009201.1 hypothetical protein [Mobiluncus mulieris]
MRCCFELEAPWEKRGRYMKQVSGWEESWVLSGEFTRHAEKVSCGGLVDFEIHGCDYLKPW